MSSPRVNKMPYIVLTNNQFTIAFHTTEAKGIYHQKHYIDTKCTLMGYLDLDTLLYLKKGYEKLGFAVEWPETPVFFEAE